MVNMITRARARQFVGGSSMQGLSLTATVDFVARYGCAVVVDAQSAMVLVPGRPDPERALQLWDAIKAAAHTDEVAARVVAAVTKCILLGGTLSAY